MSIVRERTDRRTAAESESLQIVTFEAGRESFGLSISDVVEVVRPLPITQLPCMPEFIEGVINLRGAIIPVVDLRRRFGIPTTAQDHRKIRVLIIRRAHPGVRSGRGLLGLVVDSVRDVLQMPCASIEAAPEAATGSNADLIAGMAKAADRLIILLDIRKILNRSERSALAEVDDVLP